MSWTPPDLHDLIEERLQRALAELEVDSRLIRAAEGLSSASPAFLGELIDKKLAAAYQSGLEAVEASLRHEATNQLLDAEYELDTVRRIVEQAGADLLTPPPAIRRAPATWSPGPLAIAALVYVASSITVLALWTTYNFHPLWTVLGIGASLLPAWAVHRGVRYRAAQAARKIVSEYPALLARLYYALYEERTAAYSAELRKALPASPSLALPYHQMEAETGVADGQSTR